MTVTITRGGYQVEVLADSMHTPGWYSDVSYHRLTTCRVRMPRIVLAELNTHRVFSRNGASSRAIGINKMIQRVVDEPFIPHRFPKAHTGMQANEWITPGMPEYTLCREEWLASRDQAVASARRLADLKISKQLANRLLEPWVWHEAIISSTEWENFLALRANPMAQDEIRIIAEMILDALNTSTPKVLLAHEWHIPFGDRMEVVKLGEAFNALKVSAYPVQTIEELKRIIAVARCARVSYLNHMGHDNYIADATLFRDLVENGHMSPLEHVAHAMNNTEYRGHSRTSTWGQHTTEYGWCGNFRGFIQMRKIFPGENRIEPRLNRKNP